jgi:hypothetical protein
MKFILRPTDLLQIFNGHSWNKRAIHAEINHIFIDGHKKRMILRSKKSNYQEIIILGGE